MLCTRECSKPVKTQAVVWYWEMGDGEKGGVFYTGDGRQAVFALKYSADRVVERPFLCCTEQGGVASAPQTFQ